MNEKSYDWFGWGYRVRECDEALEKLKPDIDAFLFTRLPDDTTLKQADELALDIYDLISRLWQAHVG